MTRPATPATADDRLPAAVDLLGRTGAAEFQIRYCEEEDPTVWVAAARWGGHWEAAGAMTPLRAVFRLCDEVIDGGMCVHCQRPAGFAPDLDPMPLDQLVCWQQWDPERITFRRSCEGDTPPPTRHPRAAPHPHRPQPRRRR